MTQLHPLRLFISYAHEDDGYRRDLEAHLISLKHQKILEIWSDRAIEAGQEWERSISDQLQSSDIILLLISKNFLASEFIYKKELIQAMERHAAGQARVIPVFLRPCYWKGEIFGKLQGVPDDAKPISKWDNYDEAFTYVAEAISRAAEGLAKERTQRRTEERAGQETSTQAKRAAAPKPDTWPDFTVFRDVPFAPEMVILPAGEFLMGSPESDNEAFDKEKPQHRVQIGYRLAVGRYPVTFEEWDASVADGGVGYRPNDRGWGRGLMPVTNVSWNDAKQYIAWLSRKTGQTYRLLSEAEWEYAARAGTTTARWWSNDITPQNANYNTGYRSLIMRVLNIGRILYLDSIKMTTVGSYPESPFKLYDMLGNVEEWVGDCWNANYIGAPNNGAAWTTGDCRGRVVRGGSWMHHPRHIRSAYRQGYPAGFRFSCVGFRVARTL